jgi:hypothetical protein
MNNACGHRIFVVSTVSQQITLPARSEESRLRGYGIQTEVTVFNLKANTAYVALSDAASAASTDDTEVPAGGYATLPLPPSASCYIAAIAADAPTVLCVSVGN